MNLREIIQVIDELPEDELQTLQQHISQRLQLESATSDQFYDIQQRINELLQNAEPIELTPNTMDIDRLQVAVEAMREGLTQAELNEIADAMDEEYIKHGNSEYDR